MFKNLFVLTFFLLVNLIFDSFFHSKILDEPKHIVVQQGMKLDDITELLFENEIIKNKLAFKIWIKLNFYEKKLKYGEYFFHKKLSILDVSNKLVSGNSIHRKLTIIEGSYKYNLLQTLKQIDPNTNLSLIDIPDNIIANTYSYELTDSAERIISNILDLSSKYADKIWNKRNKRIPLQDVSEMFVLGSIVEKETSLKREKSIIAGVFFNRLEKKMRLQSDPTVEFSITKGQKKLGRSLLRKDLKFASDFNTYLNFGLPPSPICFPGIESLNGVVNPYKSDFLYFVSNNTDGGHFFSSNYKDHLKKIRHIKSMKKNGN